MPTPQHQQDTVEGVRCAIVTVSDTRTPETDSAGALIKERLAQAGHTVCSHEILPDEPARVRAHVAGLCESRLVQAILLTGGTGLAARDTTYEAIAALLSKRLDGFGELFRMLSYHDVGPAAMLSRAVAGVCQRTAVFSMPGSRGAVALAMDKLIVPELGHIAALLGD